MPAKALIAIISGVAALVLLFSSAYTVKTTEQVILTQFGEIVGEPVTRAGLHFKVPFVQDVNRLDKLVLEWSGGTRAIPTMDKLYIVVETFARWRIVDPKKYYLSMNNDERRAQSRLDDILGSQTRNAIAGHNLIEIVRTQKDRKAMIDQTLAEVSEDLARLPPINYGRARLEQLIFQGAKPILLDQYGIELLDVRFKRVNYDTSVISRINERMISERSKIADKFRSEGQGRASEIIGTKERELKTILSNAYRQSEEIRGKADAEAASVYSKSFNESPAAAEFYQFLKTLESYEKTIDSQSTLVISSKSEFLKFLNGTGGIVAKPDPEYVPPPPPPPVSLEPAPLPPREEKAPAAQPQPETMPEATPPSAESDITEESAPPKSPEPAPESPAPAESQPDENPPAEPPPAVESAPAESTPAPAEPDPTPADPA